jgi:hypothetical protein
VRVDKALHRILKDNMAREAWEKLKAEISKRDLKNVARYLVAIANRQPVLSWEPPNPHQARQFAERVKALAAQIERMSLYYGVGFPPNDHRFKDLPQNMVAFAERLEAATRNRKKVKPPNDFLEREIAILHLLDRSEPGHEKHYYEQAAELIQRAYLVAGDSREVDAEQLRKLYDRQSLRYRLKAGGKNPPPKSNA